MYIYIYVLPTNCYQSHRFLIQIFDNTPRSNPPRIVSLLGGSFTVAKPSTPQLLRFFTHHLGPWQNDSHVFPNKNQISIFNSEKKTCFPRLGNPIVPRGLVAKHREVHKKLATTISATEIHKSTNHGSFQLRSLQPQVFFTPNLHLFSNSHRMSQTNFNILHDIYLHVSINKVYISILKFKLPTPNWISRTFLSKQLFGSTPTRLSPLPWVISLLSDRSSISHGCINAS